MLMKRLFGHRKAKDDEGAWDLPTSMIDVVFLLLIFFMCASKFRVLERRLDAFLPNVGHPPRKINPDVEPIPIKVSARPDARGLAEYRVRRWVSTDPNKLAALLTRLPRPAKYRAEIDAGQNCQFRHVMSAVDACARARITDISFLPPPVAAESGG
jgi:biopolymer transport protein ExbD